MAQHRFKIGQKVRLSLGKNAGPTAAGEYTVVQRLPSEGSGPQYRVKSEKETFMRVALERTLSPG